MSINRGLDKEDVAHTYNRISLSHKKNKTMPFAATSTDLEMTILNKISQIKKDKHHTILLICGILKKKKRYK